MSNFFTITLCRTRQQYLRAPIDRHILVALWPVYSTETVKVTLLQLQQVSAGQDRGRRTHHPPGLQASTAVIDHPPSETAHTAITLPPVPLQPHVRPNVAQREVHHRMETGQHVEAQIKDL